MWTIQCLVERPDASIEKNIQEIDGISNVRVDGNSITLSCYPNTRPKVAQTLVGFGLLEMRRIDEYSLDSNYCQVDRLGVLSFLDRMGQFNRLCTVEWSHPLDDALGG